MDTASHYRIFRDTTGRLQVEAVAGGDPVVADFVFTDVRENPLHCGEIIGLIDRARNGEAGLESIGNIYVLTLSQHGARLENIHDAKAPSAGIALDELAELLDSWRHHLG
jgi:uncharacterized protein YacL (UPF0231 family)